MRPKNSDLFTAAQWWKSSRSAGSNGGACVEFTDSALTTHGVVGVRDTKDHGRGPIIAVSGTAWRNFLTVVRDGQVDL
jgi:hypothetical protein